ncbi:dnaJ homolog subfamily C member 17-like [Eriocheir sinensis]|uniref:dnaJ homolog subfamily C member 17-like n=1 Tax=Eriocheir sinensis TaxID=95602 RepID=UPI0021C64851|nr:dnaJ homolog subfamily C member 17-like [Eriocheir sinensis]
MHAQHTTLGHHTVTHGASMATTRHYHGHLGLARGATERAIRRQCRSLALAAHPDKNPQDVAAATAMLQQLQLEVQTFCDTDSRVTTTTVALTYTDVAARAKEQGEDNCEECLSGMTAQEQQRRLQERQDRISERRVERQERLQQLNGDGKTKKRKGRRARRLQAKAEEELSRRPRKIRFNLKDVPKPVRTGFLYRLYQSRKGGMVQQWRNRLAPQQQRGGVAAGVGSPGGQARLAGRGPRK